MGEIVERLQTAPHQSFEVGIVTRAPQPLSRELLARRLRVLLEVVALDGGEMATFSRVREYLSSRGMTISPGRWMSMISGTGSWASDDDLLAALADLFEVPPAYLLDEDARSQAPGP